MSRESGDIPDSLNSVLVRKLPMYQHYRNDVEFAFSYVVASRYDSYKIGSKYKKGSDEVSFGEDEFSRHFKVISIHELIAGNFDRKDLEDKIVILGYISNSDPFYLDKEKTVRISGTEIQASLISKILND